MYHGQICALLAGALGLRGAGEGLGIQMVETDQGPGKWPNDSRSKIDWTVEVDHMVKQMTG